MTQWDALFSDDRHDRDGSSTATAPPRTPQQIHVDPENVRNGLVQLGSRSCGFPRKSTCSKSSSA